MKKRVQILLLLAAMAFVLVVSCSKNTDNPIPLETKDDCKGYVTAAARDSCYAALSLSSNNPSVCSKSSNQDLCLSILKQSSLEFCFSA